MKFRKIVFLSIFAAALINSNAGAQSLKNNFLTDFNYKSISLNDTVKSSNLADAPPKWHECVTKIPGDCVDYLNITFRTNKIPLYLGASLLTAVLVATDRWTYTQSDNWYRSSNFVKSASDIFVSMGDGTSQFGLAAAFASYGLIAGNNKALRTGSQIIEAVLASGFVVQILKHITGRESPFVSTSESGKWVFFPNQIDYLKHVPHYDAFPSGHLTTGLATVIVIAENYPDQKWIRPFGYLVCTGIAISMVNTGIHWYSDYPLAIILGYTFGMLASHPEGLSDVMAGSSDDKGFKVIPQLEANGLSFNARFNF